MLTKVNTVCHCCRNSGHFLFGIHPFALHRQQPEKDKQNVVFAAPGKISADALAYTFSDRLLVDETFAQTYSFVIVNCPVEVLNVFYSTVLMRSLI